MFIAKNIFFLFNRLFSFPLINRMKYHFLFIFPSKFHLLTVTSYDPYHITKYIILQAAVTTSVNRYILYCVCIAIAIWHITSISKQMQQEKQKRISLQNGFSHQQKNRIEKEKRAHTFTSPEQQFCLPFCHSYSQWVCGKWFFYLRM